MDGRRIFWAIAASAIGFGVNAALPLPGPFGLDFLFGAVVVYAYALLAKDSLTPYVVALIAFAGQYYYWGHPFTATISLIEFIFVYYLRFRLMPLALTVIFSGTLGPILSYLFYGLIMGMPADIWASISIKNSVATVASIGLAYLLVAALTIWGQREMGARDFHRTLLLPVILTPAAFVIIFNSSVRAKIEVERQTTSWRLAVGAVAGEMIERRGLAAEPSLQEAFSHVARTIADIDGGRTAVIYRVRRTDNAVIELACVPDCNPWVDRSLAAEQAIARLTGGDGIAFLSPGSGQDGTWQRAALAVKSELGAGEYLVGITSSQPLFAAGLKGLRIEYMIWVALTAFLVGLGWLFERWALIPLSRMSAKIARASSLPNVATGLPHQAFGELEDLRKTIESYASQIQEAHIKASELDEQMSLIAQRAPMVFATWRLQRRFGRPQLVSSSAPPEERVGLSQAIFEDPRAASAFVHPEDRRIVSRMLAELRQTSHAGAEFRMIGLDGQWRWLLFRFSRRMIADNVLELVGVITDVTRANFVLEHRTHKDRLAMMGRMISGMAHELNQPLNVISMAAGNIANHVSQELTDHPKTSDYVLAKTSKMLEQVERASRLLVAMESISSRDGTAMRQIDLVTLASDCIHEMATSHGEPIDLKVPAGGASARIFADQEKLKTVISSILLNAIDFMKMQRAASSIYDAVHMVVEIQIFLTLNHVRLTIKDFGPGFEESNIPFLFTPFSSESARAEGAGLSLAKCFSIIRAMDGEIYAKNHERGALVSMYFPIAE